jgi:hypothetical protein
MSPPPENDPRLEAMGDTPRFLLAYHPASGKMSRAEVIDIARDYLADLDDVPDEDFKVVSSLHLPADDQVYVFDVALITDLSGELRLR